MRQPPVFRQPGPGLQSKQPLDHYFNPPEGVSGSHEAARQALQLTFLHWGLHGWAIYALVGLAVAYFAYRHNQPLALRWALYPLMGEADLRSAWFCRLALATSPSMPL